MDNCIKDLKFSYEGPAGEQNMIHTRHYEPTADGARRRAGRSRAGGSFRGWPARKSIRQSPRIGLMAWLLVCAMLFASRGAGAHNPNAPDDPTYNLNTISSYAELYTWAGLTSPTNSSSYTTAQ